MIMKFKDGKSKALTLSYDDGVVQDIRFVKILDKYGLKATFNVNSGGYAPEDKERAEFKGRMKLSEAKELFANSTHEVAIHALTHPWLNKIKTDEIITEILEDRRRVEKDYGKIARGMAYPYGAYNDEVIDVLKKCGVCYSRTTKATENFEIPQNWLTLHPTCHHNCPRLMDLAKRFVETPSAKVNGAWLFYLWGHSYEFDNDDNWETIESFSQYVAGKDDIWYATNIEIYDYVKAYESLQTSVDKNMIYNPTKTDVWFSHGGKTHLVKGGETLYII